LLAGIEGVALAANLHPHRRLGGPKYKGIATGARDSGCIVLGMNVFLHVMLTYLEIHGGLLRINACPALALGSPLELDSTIQ
jgi:hypothetical protein